MKKQKGFALVSAIFIMVILSLIGRYILSLSTLSNTTTQLSGLGAKAYYAAKSGLEWCTYKVAPPGSVGPLTCPASKSTLTFKQGGLSGLSTLVTCRESVFTEYGISYKIFQINAIGQYGTVGDADYVSRELYITVVQKGI